MFSKNAFGMRTASRNTLRAFSVVGLTGALLGTAVIPGLLTQPHAVADTTPKPIITTADTTWTYDASDTDPAAGNADRLVWTKDGFAGKNWQSGKAPFGFKYSVDKDGKVTDADNADGYKWATKLPYATAPKNPDIRTYHFRTEVTLTKDQLDSADGFEASIRVDDAAQVFVNGKKVDGLADKKVEAAPEAQRNLMYAGINNGAPASKTFTIAKDAFKEGKNVISVALYQNDEASSDAYFDFISLTPVAKNATQTVAPKALIQTVGATDSERNFTWYTMNKQVAQELQYAPAAEVKNGAFPATATSIKATSDGDVHTRDFQTPEFNYRATIKDLKPETEYSYRVGNEKTGWSPVYTFKTPKFTGNYNFMFYGDPQIGASHNTAVDEKGWKDTIALGLKTYPNTDMLFSAGDQVEAATNEDHYDAFLAPDALRTLPFAPIIGNHDVSSQAFLHHYTVPNYDKKSGSGCATNKNNCNDPEDYSDGDYYFVHKDTLFVVLNSNANSDKSIAEHKAFMEKAVAANPNVKWKVLGFHHSIYSVAEHSTGVWDSPNIAALRGGEFNEPSKESGLVSEVSKLGFDLVLMGHDHVYTRTFLLKNDGTKAHLDEAEGAHDVDAKNGETVYLTANSASGSKFYDQKLKVASDKDPKHEKFPVAPYASVVDQQTLRNYTNIDVQECQLTLTTLVSGTHPVRTKADQIKDAFKDAQGNVIINKKVDEVVVHSKKDRCEQKPAVTPVPDQNQNKQVAPTTDKADGNKADANQAGAANQQSTDKLAHTGSDSGALLALAGAAGALVIAGGVIAARRRRA